MITRTRDASDPESVTAVIQKLDALARRLLTPRPLTPAQVRRLRRLARSGKPSEITRTLQGWRFHLSDQTVRRLEQKKLFAFVWQ